MSFKELAVPVYLKDGKALQRPEGGMLAGGEYGVAARRPLGADVPVVKHHAAG